MYTMMYYNHNLDFGAASYAMAGQFEEARKLAGEVTSNVTMIVIDLPPVDPFATGTMKVLLRFGKWNDLLALPAETPGPYTAAFRHFVRGTAFARLGKLDEARAERKELEAWLPSLGDDIGMLQNSTKSLAGVAAAMLDGRISEAAGDRDAAIASYRRAVAAEDALSYNEPADWFSPTRETLGGALLRAKDFAGAEHVFRDDLTRNPDNPRSLFGLAQALAGQKKEAAATEAAFKKVWKGARLSIADF